MIKRIALVLLVVAGVLLPLAAAAAGDPNDAEGSKDPALFTRMPGFFISEYQQLDFDRHEFPVGPGKTQAVEGRYTYVDYYVNDGVKVPSGLQVIRNYVNAAKAVGGTVVYQFEDGGMEYATLQIVKGDAEVWAQVEGAGNGMYKLRMVEKEAMAQEVTADAASLSGSIEATGKAAVYGIFFDTDRAELKPASEPALIEIAKMLASRAGLKIFVVGHTDNAGSFDHNLKLSQQRAAAVVKALTGQYKVAAARLTPFGAGPTCPAASNGTEEGRARNRRVELVAQ